MNPRLPSRHACFTLPALCAAPRRPHLRLSLQGGMVLAAACLLGGRGVAFGNTEVDVNKTGSADLTAAGSYAGGSSPSSGSDVTFTTGTYTTTTFNIATGNLNIGTLDDLAGSVLTIQNGTAGNTSTITLNGGTNVVAPAGANGGNAGDLLYVKSSNLTIGNTTGALGLALAASGNFDIAGGVTTVNSIVSGSGFGFTKTGAGQLFLTGANTYSGGTTLSAGVTRFSVNSTFAGGAVTSGAFGSGTLTMAEGSILASSAGNTIGNALSITGNVSFGFTALTGRIILANNVDLGGTVGTTVRTATVFRNFAPSAYTTGTGLEQVQVAAQTGGPTGLTVANGTLRFVQDASVPAGNLTPVGFATTVGFTGNAGLSLGSGLITTFATTTPFLATASPRVTVDSGAYFNLGQAATSRSAVVYSLSGAGVVTNLAGTAGTSTVTINGADTATFSGTIADGSAYAGTFTGIVGGTSATPIGTVALTMSGTGTQTLSGANTYTGATLVSGGTLLVNGSIGTGGTPGGAVTVNAAGRLGGTGILTVASASVAGTLAPGGTLGATTGALTLNTTSGLTLTGTLQIGITASGGTSLSTNGLLNITGSTLTVTGTSGAAAYDIANYGSETGTFAILNIPSGYTINYAGTTFNPGGDIELNATAVPEPSTWFATLLTMVAGAVVGYRRRTRKV